MIHKDTSSCVLLVHSLFTIGVQESAVWLAVEVVDRDLLSGKETIFLKQSNIGCNRPFYASWGSSASLFGILTGGTHWARVEESSLGLGAT